MLSDIPISTGREVYLPSNDEDACLVESPIIANNHHTIGGSPSVWHAYPICWESIQKKYLVDVVTAQVGLWTISCLPVVHRQHGSEARLSILHIVKQFLSTRYELAFQLVPDHFRCYKFTSILCNEVYCWYLYHGDIWCPQRHTKVRLTINSPWVPGLMVDGMLIWSWHRRKLIRGLRCFRICQCTS